MNAVGELIKTLRGRLQRGGFGEYAQGSIGEVDFAAVMATPKQSSRRIVCAVAHVSDSEADGGAAALARSIRRSLSKHLPGLPRPKRLGTFTVLLADHEVCRKLRDQKGEFVDSSGLHVNVLLGTVLVDVDEFRIYSDNVWGLIDAGEQFKRIQDAVEAWCILNRRRKPAKWGGGLVGVA